MPSMKPRRAQIVNGSVKMKYVMIRAGINYIGDDELRPLGLIAGGVVVTILGIGMTVTGGVLLGIGATKLRKYCRKSDQQSFYLIAKPTGVGFACRF